MGEIDYFRVDSEIFFEKLNDAGCNATKIVIPEWNHFLAWQRLYAIYLAQEITKKDTSVNYEQIVAMDAKLREAKLKETQLIAAKKEKMSEADRTKYEEECLNLSIDLKSLCEKLNAVSIFKLKPQNIYQRKPEDLSTVYSQSSNVL